MADPETADALSIGELAKRAGVSARTIRLYEELGILPTPARSPGGTRRYTADDQFSIEGALLLKEVGFTLEELKLVGRLARGASISPTDRRAAERAIATKMRALKHRIRVLQRLHEVFSERTTQEPSPTGLVELLEASAD
jgi:DNA-binding transcriptional MerR regulator